VLKGTNFRILLFENSAIVTSVVLSQNARVTYDRETTDNI